MLYLTLKLRVKFESLDLLRAIASIMKKLENQGETLYVWFRRGAALAWVFSEFAVACGNTAAASWRSDRGYALYLGRTLGIGNGGFLVS